MKIVTDLPAIHPRPGVPPLAHFKTGDTAVIFYSQLLHCATAHTVLSLDFMPCSLFSV